MQFSTFAIEYLHEKGKKWGTVFAYSYAVQVESSKHKKSVDNLVTLSL